MAAHYSKGFEFDADGEVCVELPAPPRGTLRAFIVRQVEGNLDGFACSVLDKDTLCDSSISESGDLDPAMHLVIEPITVNAASAMSRQLNLNAGYQNRDSGPIVGTPNSRLYMQLQPAGSGGTFQVSYTIEPVGLL